ncbi:MAG: hypothetical protein GY742_21865, partial [Hyphomicrobiales bacterium]|nr:hypothetical protein [Hyphomicrobiales bacterium]
LNRRINAQIDRIAILENTVVIVDYKSDRHIPSLPEKISSRYLVQLAIYRELVAQIFEGKQVKCSLVWTSGPQIIDIPDELLSSHLNAWLDAAKHSRVKGQTDA